MFHLLADHYGFWLPENASRVGEFNDNLFNFILWINIFFSSLIMALLIWFVFKYRHREGTVRHDPTGGHSTALELTWTIIPTLLVLVIFWYGFRGYLHANTMPPNAYKIQANGAMWKWTFTYPTGLTDDELHLVLNQPTEFDLQSVDVIHDLDIPVFRTKKDAVPGRTNHMWVEPTLKTQPGEWFQVYCAMYCGTNHSTMLAKCIVEDQASFDKWMAGELVWEPKMSFIDRGQKLYHTMGCVSCHSIDGTIGTAPSWKDLYGSTVPLEGGTSVLADDGYINESIVDPGAKIVLGFKNVMPGDFKAKLKPNDLLALTWYMKSISSHYTGDLKTGNTVGEAKVPGKGETPSLPATAPVAAPGDQPRPPTDNTPGK